MAEETKSAPPNSNSGASEKSAPASSEAGQNGKGDSPRNCFSDSYRSNFDKIKWGK